MIGLPVLISILIPVKVLIIEIASAPFASADFAISAISVTLGLSFTIRGFLQWSRTYFVMLATLSQDVPKATPPLLTLGQLMLSSIISISVSLSFSAI